MKTSFIKVVLTVFLGAALLLPARSTKAQVVTMDPGGIAGTILQTLQDADVQGWFNDISQLTASTAEFEKIIEDLKAVGVGIAAVQVAVSYYEMGLTIYKQTEDYVEMAKLFYNDGQWYQVLNARLVVAAYRDRVQQIIKYSKERLKMFEKRKALLAGKEQTTSGLGYESAINTMNFANDIIREVTAMLREAKWEVDYYFYRLYMDKVRLENSLANFRLLQVNYY